MWLRAISHLECAASLSHWPACRGRAGAIRVHPPAILVHLAVVHAKPRLTPRMHNFPLKTIGSKSPSISGISSRLVVGLTGGSDGARSVGFVPLASPKLLACRG